jgi:hypothetical protein
MNQDIFKKMLTILMVLTASMTLVACSTTDEEAESDSSSTKEDAIYEEIHDLT